MDGPELRAYTRRFAHPTPARISRRFSAGMYSSTFAIWSKILRLEGFMGCGKSSIAALISEADEVPVLNPDGFATADWMGARTIAGRLDLKLLHFSGRKLSNHRSSHRSSHHARRLRLNEGEQILPDAALVIIIRFDSKRLITDRLLSPPRTDI